MSVYIRAHLKRVAGRLIGAALPGLSEEVRRGYLGGGRYRRRIKHWIAGDDFQRLLSQGKDKEVQTVLSARWTSQKLVPGYYDQFATRFREFIEGPHAVSLDWLETFAKERRITEILEVGCGDGQALQLVADRLPETERLVGLDINESIIERNKTRYSHEPRLSFEAGDATDRIENRCGSGTLLMSIGGVMEYIAPSTLERWFVSLAQNGAAGVLLVEPIDHSHNLEQQPDSFIHGNEDSFSHNHVRMLQDAGLRIKYRAEAQANGARWIMLLAEVPIPQQSDLSRD